jgi:hypothetical protein
LLTLSLSDEQPTPIILLALKKDAVLAPSYGVSLPARRLLPACERAHLVGFNNFELGLKGLV